MRVLRVHNRYRERGGEDSSFEAEVDLLRDAGHTVSTVEFSNSEIPIQPTVRNRARLATTTIWSTASRERIATEIERFRPEVAHFDNTFPLVSPAAYSACTAAGVAVVQTLHNYRLLCPSATFYRDGHPCEDCLGKTPPLPSVVHGCYRDSRSETAVVAAMLTAHRLRRTWTRDVDRYIALTEFARSKFIEGGLPSDLIAAKPHFVLPGSTANLTDRQGFVFVGRLVDYKGADLLEPAWQRLEHHAPLNVIGDGPLSENMDRAASADSRIDHPGRQNRLQVQHAMGLSMAVIVPSRLYETFGLTIIEAFACSTPVIASRLGAMAEIVQDGVTGLLFEPGNAEDLAAKVRWAADNPEEMRRMGANARREYEAKYTPERNYALLMDIYRQAVDHSRRRGT